MDRPNYYDLLQVSPGADPAVIEAAYRGLASKYQGDPARLAELNEAYSVLGDPQRRASYDLSLQGQPPPAPARVPPPPQQPVVQRTGSTRFETYTPVGDLPPAAPPVRQGRGLAFWILAILGACALSVVAMACLLFFLFTPLRNAVSRTLRPASPPLVAAGTPTTAGTTATAASPGSSAFITNVVLARDTKGDNYQPVDVTNTFSPSDTFHAVVTIQNAPDNSSVRAVWTADNVGGSASPNTKIDEYSLTTSGSRNLDFTLKPKSAWPIGTYHVDVYGNDNLARTVSFTVAGAATSNATPSNSVIDKTTFSRSVSPDVFDPTDPTTTFSPNEKVLHLVVAIKDAPDNTQFKVSWYTGDQLIDTTTLNAGGARNLDFSLTQSGPWAAGSYHVDIFVNGNLDRTVQFKVQ